MQGQEQIASNLLSNYNDSIRMGNHPLPTDASAMQRYIEYYLNDEVGNLLHIRHDVGSSTNWRRDFTIDSATNKITASSIGSDGTGTETFTYGDRGNIISGFNHLSSLVFNEENRIQRIEVTGSITDYYQYDYNGQRVRKVTDDTGSKLLHERRYIETQENYTRTDTGIGVVIDRTSIHVMDGERRVVIVDVDNLGGKATYRYQFTNHLGTASLELDEDANIISYEEYYPYGNTSFQSGDSTDLISLKRYRYIGKERDEQTGFYYMGARYYVPWLGRWLGVDPISDEWYNLCKGQLQRSAQRQFVELCASSFQYCYANPIRFIDPTGEFGYEGDKKQQQDMEQQHPIFTEFLKTTVKETIRDSDRIKNELSYISQGQLSKSKIQSDTEYGQGPGIVIGDLGGFFGKTDIDVADPKKITITISDKLIQKFEDTMKSETATPYQKQMVQLEVFGTILHEYAHYGDMLDGMHAIKKDDGSIVNGTGNEFKYVPGAEKYPPPAVEVGAELINRVYGDDIHSPGDRLKIYERRIEGRDTFNPEHQESPDNKIITRSVFDPSVMPRFDLNVISKLIKNN